MFRFGGAGILPAPAFQTVHLRKHILQGVFSQADCLHQNRIHASVSELSALSDLYLGF